MKFVELIGKDPHNSAIFNLDFFIKFFVESGKNLQT